MGSQKASKDDVDPDRLTTVTWSIFTEDIESTYWTPQPDNTRLNPKSMTLLLSTVIMATVGTVSLLGNATLIFTIFRPRNRFSLWTPGSLLVANLALGDLLFAPLVLPAMIIRQWVLITDPVLCGGFLVTMFSVSTVSSMGYLIVTVERYIAICHPYKVRYKAICHPYKVP